MYPDDEWDDDDYYEDDDWLEDDPYYDYLERYDPDDWDGMDYGPEPTRWEELVYEIKWRIKSIPGLFIRTCPSCRKVEGVLWWAVGNHNDCLPF